MPLPDGFRIVPLIDVAALIDEVARLHDEEWGHFYPDIGPERLAEGFLSEKPGTIPFTLVLLEHEDLVGTISVILDDCPVRRDLNPWLASFLVLPSHRGRGFGRLLLNEALHRARAAGLEELFVFTETAAPLFRSAGFEFLATEMLEGHEIDILRLRFRNPE